jgi:hypothetical protein
MGYWKHMSGNLLQPSLCLDGLKILTCKDLDLCLGVYCNECESDWPLLEFRRIHLLASFEAFAAVLLRSSFSVISRCATGRLVSDVARHHCSLETSGTYPTATHHYIPAAASQLCVSVRLSFYWLIYRYWLSLTWSCPCAWLTITWWRIGGAQSASCPGRLPFA